MLIYFWIVVVFVFGVVVGSFLNVCVARLPMEKSLIWPGSRCGSCLQPIRWYDNIPLISYLVLRGKCRHCHARFSIRYFAIELLTGLGFVGLMYLEVALNIHQWSRCNVNQFDIDFGLYPWQWWVGFGFHAILFSFLLAASFCDIESRTIPLGLTVTGTIIGLIGAILLPWPWPWTPAEALAPIRQFQQKQVMFGNQPIAWWMLPNGIGPKEGIYPWPFWGPVPQWAPPGTWQMGLATGLIGLLAGSMFVRAVAFLFSKGLGKEALGLGDADLMMMAGAFLGWQLVVVAFFVSVFPALFVGVFQIIFYRDSSLPFGPSLAMGVLITMLCWRWIAPAVQILFFWDLMLICLVVVAAGFMFLSSFMLRAFRPKDARS